MPTFLPSHLPTTDLASRKLWFSPLATSYSSLGWKDRRKYRRAALMGLKGLQNHLNQWFSNLLHRAPEFCRGVSDVAKMFGAKGRARGLVLVYFIFTPLLYDGLVYTDSLEKRLLLTKRLKATFIVQSFFGWLTIPLS